MADIELVIKIPEESYEFAKECKSKGSSKYNWNLTFNNIVFMIANGTPLPKVHGDLIDVSTLITVTDIKSDGSEFTYVPYSEIEDAPTIIERDKAESEG